MHFHENLFRKKLLSWYEKNKKPHPWRLMWNQDRDPYPVWVSEILLQQTTLSAATPAFLRFLSTFPDPTSLAQAEELAVKQVVQGLGYYRRFSFLKRAAEQLSLKEKNKRIIWPQTYDEWKKLPGVGDYTASAVSSIVLNLPEPSIDGNVERVLSRLFDIREPILPKTKAIFKEMSRGLICRKCPGDYNQAMMEIGQTVCRVKSPSCDHCPLSSFCLAKERKSIHLAPSSKTMKPRQTLLLHLVIMQDGSRYGLVERPSSAKFLKGVTGFLTAIDPDCVSLEDSSDQRLYQMDGRPELFCQEFKRIGAFKHSITHHDLLVSVSLSSAQLWTVLSPVWLAPDDLEAKLVSSLDIKAWNLLRKSKEGRLVPLKRKNN